MPGVADTSTFPAPVYKDTVLAPLFDAAKTHHAAEFRRIDRAHAVMLAETGILTDVQAGAILRALADIDASTDLAALVYTGEVEDFFFHVEAELKGRLGPDLAGRLHTGRSRNDIDHTIFKLALKHRLDALAAKGRALATALLAKATAERDTPIVAYTHGQPAQASTFGHYLSAALEVLLRDLQRIEAARDTVDRCSMGAAAITTTGFPIDRHRMAALLGFEAPLENAYGCIASIDYVTAPYSAIKLLFVHLGRLIQDLQVWSGFEVGQIYVPNAYVQISSIMPQKRNPVPIEHLRLLASLTVGRCDTIVGAMHNTPFTDMNDSEAEVQSAGYAAFDSGARVLDLLAGLIGAVRIDPERVQRNADAACVTITELADSLVRLEGLSFRQAHEIAADVARAVVEDGGSLAATGYAPFRESFRAHIGRDSTVGADRFAQLVSMQQFIAVRDRFGGPAPAAMDAALARYREALNGLTGRAEAAAAREAAAGAELDACVTRLMQAA